MYNYPVGVGATFEIIITGGKKRERERELKKSRFDAVDNAQLATRN